MIKQEPQNVKAELGSSTVNSGQTFDFYVFFSNTHLPGHMIQCQA
jgi:hypothetical protein